MRTSSLLTVCTVSRLATTMLLLTSTLITAFSTPSSSTTPRPFIEFTNPLSNTPGDRLPASFVSNWPTWVLDLNSNHDNKWQKIPDSDGFVPPTSIEELWQPQDLKQPNCQLALGLHVRDGMIRHILPAVDLSLLGGGGSGSGSGEQQKRHRNRGLCSVPRAYQWMDFGAAMAGGLDVMSLSLQICDQQQQQLGDDKKPTKSSWQTLAEIESIEDIITAAIEALADDPPIELGDGSTIVHILCDTTTTTKTDAIVKCPKPGSEIRVLLEEDGITVGALQVSVEKTAPGSESEYLPDAYKPLFQDESLRRPAYIETKRRMEMRAASNRNVEK